MELDDPEVVFADAPPLLQTIQVSQSILFQDLVSPSDERVGIRSFQTSLDKSARGGSNDPNNPAEWSDFYKSLRGFLDRQILFESNERVLDALKRKLAKTTGQVWTLKDEILVFDPQPCRDGRMHQPEPVKYVRADFNKKKNDKLTIILTQMREKLFNVRAYVSSRHVFSKPSCSTALDCSQV